MKTTSKICIHCGVQYFYQLSGNHRKKHNNRDYCPDCYESICKHLETIPKKFDTRYIKCEDFTKEEAIELASLVREKPDDHPKDIIWLPALRRVFPCLYDLETGTSSHDREFTKDGVDYYVHWWDDRDDWYLKKEVRWDILNEKEA